MSDFPTLKLSEVQWAEGSGAIDTVTSHGWLSRIFYRFRFLCTIANPASFQRGDVLWIYPPTGDFRRGSVKVSQVRIPWIGKPILEFEDELPAQTRKGDLLVRMNAR